MKAYLAMVQGPRGIEHQLWWKEREGDHFVCGGLTPIGAPRLIPEGERTVARAVKWSVDNPCNPTGSSPDTTPGI